MLFAKTMVLFMIDNKVNIAQKILTHILNPTIISFSIPRTF